MTNAEKVEASRVRHSGFVIDSSSACHAVAWRRRVIRLPRRSAAKAGHSSFFIQKAFTLIELIVVVGLILILAGLVLSTAGYARKKGARSRAETEIAAMSAACESYKADNGIYPRDTTNNATDNLAALTDPSYASKTPPDPVPCRCPSCRPDPECTVHSRPVWQQLRLFYDSSSDGGHYNGLQSYVRSLEHEWSNC